MKSTVQTCFMKHCKSVCVCVCEQQNTYNVTAAYKQQVRKSFAFDKLTAMKRKLSKQNPFQSNLKNTNAIQTNVDDDTTNTYMYLDVKHTPRHNTLQRERKKEFFFTNLFQLQ